MPMPVKIVAIDFDDVLSDSIPFWISWVCMRKDNYYCFDNLKTMKANIPLTEYENLKEEYRTSGIKIKIPEIVGAGDIVRELKKQGYFIVILTARPIFIYDQVLVDTFDWLHQHNIPYDLIFHGKDKWKQVLNYFKKLKFMIEDNAFIANEVAKFGYRVYLLDNKYNQQPLHKNVIRIFHLSEVLEHEKLSSAAIAGNIE